MKYGFNFNGLHTYRDFGITIADKSVGYPEKEKIKVKVPFSNIEYDFSRIYGGQSYTERPLNYTLNVLDKHRNIDMHEVNTIETKLVNWLMNSNGKQRLYDDAMPGYYYLAEVEGGLDFEELRNYGTLEVEFTAYPFMIGQYLEGNDIWDTFNFELDVAQPVEFEVVRTNFKNVPIGSLATIGAWSIAYDGNVKIPKNALGETRKVIDKVVTSQGVGTYAYKLEGLENRVIEQDIVQAQNGAVDINIINAGSTSVVPKITSTYPISIIKGNHVFNIWKGVSLSDLFRLDPGDNHMQLTGNRLTQVKFEFRKELI